MSGKMFRFKTICSHCGKMVEGNASNCECRKSRRKVLSKEKNERYVEEKKFFNSSTWKQLRLKVIKRDSGIIGEQFCNIYDGVCLRCLYKDGIITTNDIEAHHIKSRKNYPELQWDENNLISLCKLCNTQLGTKDKLDFDWQVPNDYEPVL